MARAEIPYVVYKGQNPVQVGAGASVLVNLRGAGPATIFAAETGGGTAANPITTDAFGRINGWLDEGSYDLIVSGSGITTYTQPIEVNRGDGVGRLATNAVTQPAILNGAVSFVKLGSDVVTNLLPPGVVWPWAGGAAPTTWSLCDGASLDGTIAVNTPLWNAIGTTYGGTGQANFFKPDLRGRTVMGPDNMGTAAGSANRVTTNNARGQWSGVESVVLSIVHMPIHSHGIFDPGHTHGKTENNHSHGITQNPHTHGQMGEFAALGGSGAGAIYGPGSVNFSAHTGGGNADITINGASTGLTINPNTTSVTVNNAGGLAGVVQAHPNLPPNQVLNWIIKL